MYISAKVDYAVRALCGVAEANDAPRTAEALARLQGLPPKFLESILNDLRRAGLLVSQRGAEGGYRLAKPANEITVGDVLSFVEDGKKAKRPASDAFSGLWKRIDEAVSGVVDHTTFAEMARAWKQSQAEYVANWDI